MVADRVMMGGITGSAVTVGPGVRRDDGWGVRVDGAWGVGRGAWGVGRGAWGELANCGNIHPPNIHPPIELNLCPFAFALNFRAATQRGRRWIATDALSNLLQMRNLAWPDRGKAPVVVRGIWPRRPVRSPVARP